MQIKGKVFVRQCEICGKIKRRDGEWKHTSRLAEQSLKEYTAKGITEIVRVRCPSCEKGGCQ